jgi:hypothetical protein
VANEKLDRTDVVLYLLGHGSPCHTLEKCLWNAMLSKHTSRALIASIAPGHEQGGLFIRPWGEKKRLNAGR